MLISLFCFRDYISFSALFMLRAFSMMVFHKFSVQSAVTGVCCCVKEVSADVGGNACVWRGRRCGILTDSLRRRLNWSFVVVQVFAANFVSFVRSKHVAYAFLLYSTL